MAIINYPQTNPNFWGRGVQDRSASIIAQGKMLNHRKQVAMFGMLRDVMAEMDPQTFISDQHKLDQAGKIQEFEDYVTGLSKSKGRRQNLTQQDLMGIQWEVNKYNSWQANAMTSQKQFAQAYKIYEEDRDGRYDPVTFMVGAEEFMKTGRHPVGGYLKIAPKDYLGTAGQVESPGQVTSTRQDNVYTKDGWRDIDKTIVEHGVLTMDGESQVIDRGATEKQKDTIAWGMLMSDSGYMAWADEAYNRYKLIDPDGAAEYEKRAATYKTNAEVKGVVDGLSGKQDKDYPDEIKPSYMFAVDRYKERLWPSTVTDSKELEDKTITRKRMDRADKAAEEEDPETNLNTIAEGGDWVVPGVSASYEGGKIDGTRIATYQPKRTDEVKFKKGSTFLIDDRSWVISTPDNEDWYSSDNGSFVNEDMGILREKLKIDKVWIDYDMPTYVGEGPITYTYQGKDYTFVPGQPVAKEDLKAINAYAKENKQDVNTLIQGNTRDFMRMDLRLGTPSEGSVTVYRELTDGYAQSMVPLEGYTSRVSREEVEQSQQRMPEQEEEETKWWSPKLPSWMKRKSKEEREEARETLQGAPGTDDWEQYKR